MALQSPFGYNQFFDETGALADSFLLYHYATGTTTLKNVYSDQAGTTPHAQPIVLDTDGRVPTGLWLDTGEYAFLLKTAAGVTVPNWPINDVSGLAATGTSAFVALAGGDTMTGLFELSGNATAALNPVPLQQLTSAIATSAVTSRAATTISVADAGGFYAGTNVETVLQEVPVLTGRFLRRTIFTASGTWTKGTGTVVVDVELVGSGAGTRNSIVAQGGGGAGGYSRKRITTAGATETVTIGAGAAATAGATTSFGGHCQASGGALNNGTSNAIGGVGGVGSGGDINLTGGGGGFGAVISNPADLMGHGGSSFFGGGAPGLIYGFGTNSANGAANTGGGGSGANAAGGAGICIVTEYS